MCECQQNLFCTRPKKKVLKKSTLLLAILMTVLPNWGSRKVLSDEDHSKEFPQASTQQSWVKAVPPRDASPGSFWSCTTTCTIEAVELGNLVYDSSASSVSEYFIKSCHYWLGSLPSDREDPMEVPGYFYTSAESWDAHTTSSASMHLLHKSDFLGTEMHTATPT